ncbi:hypothetical protein VP01_514g9 [Puccinia sorghi]|uniref:N-acetyltransferase domain-containing protein n=1 Tax=Puccinia sorghi TaxID=27349 RepID=A0A0L6UL12_9BASI|nr:hypothetical protein VP01_514g9 [Puccinia sorghi]
MQSVLLVFLQLQHPIKMVRGPSANTPRSQLHHHLLADPELETICFSSESSWFQVSRKIRVQVDHICSLLLRLYHRSIFFFLLEIYLLGILRTPVRRSKMRTTDTVTSHSSLIYIYRIEETSVHVLFSLSSRPNEQIGTLRYDPTKGKISRIALLPAYRGSGIGREMMLSFERRLLAGLQSVLLADHQAAPSSLSLILSDLTPPSQIRLHSQIPVIGFYAKIGYQSIGPTFIGEFCITTSINTCC